MRATAIVLMGSYLAACGSTEPSAPQQQAPGLLVTVTTQFYGRGWPDSLAMRVDGASDFLVPANGSLLVKSIAPGDHTIAIRNPATGGGSFCVPGSSWGFPGVTPEWFQQIGTVEPDGRGHMSFKFVCIP